MMKRIIAIGVVVLLLLAVVFAAVTTVVPPSVPDFGGASSAAGQSVAQYLKEFNASLLTGSVSTSTSSGANVAVVSPPQTPANTA